MSTASQVRSAIAFEWATIDRLLAAGFEDVLVRDWEEMEEPVGEPPLAVDWPLARQMERDGRLIAWTCWSGDELVGHNTFIVSPSLHYRNTIWAVNDAIWLAPEHRVADTGVRLLLGANRRLKAMGARKIIYHARPGSALVRLLGKLGYTMAEEEWVLRL